MKSLYQAHCERWKDGCGSDQCSRATKVVFAKGSVPCDVLLVGEAPGASEDLLGYPFAGPAGKLLGEIVKNSMVGVTVAYTNLVGCLPRDSEGKKAGEPKPDQVRACEGRLTEMIKIAQPRAIVMVGDLAKKHVPQLEIGDVKLVHVVHPAFILRTPDAQQSMLIRKVEITLTQLARELTDAQDIQ